MTQIKENNKHKIKKHGNAYNLSNLQILKGDHKVQSQ